MANTVQGADTASAPLRRSDAARDALADAAARLLVERPPSAITGRELAEEAGVNYGLVHHYFRGRDGVLRAGLLRLRAAFLARHPHPDRLPLLVGDPDPFLIALVRTQVDHPNDLAREVEGHPIGTAIVDGVRARRVARGANDDVVDAKARAIALMSLQLAYGALRATLLDAAEVSADERPAVERALGRLYDDIALLDGHAEGDD